MVSLEELSNLAVLAFKNGLRLHFDSILLLKKKSYPSSVLLSVLAMEEFGKYFSLSSYLFYTDVNETRDEIFEKQYLEKLYSHPFKQKAIFGRDGFVSSTEHYNKAQNRIYEDLKQRSLYVGYERERGNFLFDKGINNPFEITSEIANEQINFINKLLIKMVEEHIRGTIEMDEIEVNKILSIRLLGKLKKNSLAIAITETVC